MWIVRIRDKLRQDLPPVFPFYQNKLHSFIPDPSAFPFHVAQDAVSPHHFLSPASFSSHFSSASGIPPIRYSSFKMKLLQCGLSKGHTLLQEISMGCSCKYSLSQSFIGSGRLPALSWFSPRADWRISPSSFFSHLSACTAALSSLFPPPHPSPPTTY